MLGRRRLWQAQCTLAPKARRSATAHLTKKERATSAYESGRLESGFLQPIGHLTPEQIEQACQAAFANAKDLLDEATLLRESGRCARAFFLAHIACEELGKLPILAAAALGGRFGGPVSWRQIDRALRSHKSKIAQALFMDSIVGDQSLATGKADYEADLRRLPLYTDLKNASLYSSLIEGRFAAPSAVIPCPLVDTFLTLARGRLGAFEGMYVRPMQMAGGLPGMLQRAESPAFKAAMETLIGAEGRKAFEMYQQTRDEAHLRSLLDQVVNDLLDSTQGRGGLEGSD
jgi:AbiV family abortive infection protein